ncbi:hypothetical protein A2T55_04235 [Brevibacterium linens]|uniref:Uncharacterized protein n=1 Tax=Brevibacterium linens TaxID=1703 RepID=A0A142NM90_BRELN|nr:hypothetical protein [Brevibacterium linens]AMT93091.1 hypothetical protein A2T55_04235 [Brevibacterium linens]
MTVTVIHTGLLELESQIEELAESLGGTVEEVHERAEKSGLSDCELSVFGRMKNLEKMYEFARNRK